MEGPLMGSASPPTLKGTDESGGVGAAPRRQYRRSYKACLNCRERKVRCDLGDLSNPYKPPCLRCRREGKECVFGESRRGGVNNVRTGLQKKAAIAVARAEKESAKIKEENPISRRELHNTTDALEILAHAARSFPKISDGGFGFQGQSGHLQTQTKQNTSVNTREVTPQKVRLADSAIVAKDKILTEEEARVLIDYFFETLHPFYPFIPDELRDPDELAEVPILLAAITTLASRYNTSLRPNEDQAIDIHVHLWDHCQALITKTVWAEASTRSVGTVFAFLLFSEWNPRAIHQRWHDYANDATTQSTHGTGDGITGFGASRRSDRMAWMLIGNGIRLAQDLGLMETDPKVFLATHLSEIVLSLRMGRRSMLHQSLNEPLPDSLEFTPFERAKLGLLQIMSLAHETLYGSRKTTRELLKNGSYLTFLSLFGPHLDNWERNCRDLLKKPSLERENILFDYHYARLYIYSLASAPESSSASNVAEIIPSSRYVGMATDAAKELLACANRVHEMGMLGKAPIRWVVRIVHATVFLVKSIMLTPTSSLEAHKHTISMIRMIAQTLRESSPDDVHLSSRFGIMLMKLQQQLVSKAGRNDEEDSVADSADMSVDSEAVESENQQVQHQHDIQQHQLQQHQQQQQQQQQQHQQHHPQQHPQQQPHAQMHVQRNYVDMNMNNNQNAFDFSRYSVLDDNSDLHMQQLSSGYATPQPQEQENQNLMAMMDIDFNFLMEGTEGLGFVEPLMEGLEHHHQMMMRQQQ